MDVYRIDSTSLFCSLMRDESCAFDHKLGFSCFQRNKYPFLLSFSCVNALKLSKKARFLHKILCLYRFWAFYPIPVIFFIGNVDKFEFRE